MKKFILENKILVILWILCGAALFIFCGHYSDLFFELGKELYYPEQIVNGKVLYKDLFLANMPFSYLFNALLYKIFSPNLMILYVMGIICSYSIVTGLYLISKKFLSEFLSLILGIFTIVCGICATHMFNYTLPYSFGMLYGTVGLIYSLYFLIKFKEKNETKFLYLSLLLGGFCLANSIDFIIYALFLFIPVIMTKNKKIILNSITSFIFIPLICSIVLFFQKLGINDILSAIEVSKEYYTTKSIFHFYKVQGILFTPKIIKFIGINLLEIILFGLAFWGGIKILEKNKIAGWIVLSLISLILFVFSSPMSLITLVPITALIAIIFAPKYKENKALSYFIAGVLTVCIKSYLMLLPVNHGNYVEPLVICAILAVLFTVINKKYEKIFGIVLIVLSISYLINSLQTRYYLNTKITTPKGQIYTYENNAMATQQLITKINQSKTDKILIYPEGLIINYLSGTKSDDYYNQITPATIETFGEQAIIDRIKETQPEYIVLNNLQLKEFGTGEICDEYAFLFKDYLFENYAKIDEVDKGFWYIVFKIIK